MWKPITGDTSAPCPSVTCHLATSRCSGFNSAALNPEFRTTISGTVFGTAGQTCYASPPSPVMRAAVTAWGSKKRFQALLTSKAGSRSPKCTGST
ncbi:unnamed protein product [Symbiodinium necroappetens]|uniref:Uncharacterized protein n=1 Tax=Symbiodinium necroappetens TaxID=1628268 RepID=A0A812P2K8_9DINO|nr:unnamed protein product [Symbiodinium necroappetens]